ncbi:nucleotidyltransferase family protein [Georgenia soli]|uniref:nucleotidyltransferase family protein n=1 Tax=Georgenia soli TaxID=638953 RepID=UPI001FE611C2|nr:nucleotidyltransferase family protein [Georgenia soli]
MPTPDPLTVTGLLLAAGAGRRMGMPKALVSTDGVPWVRRAAEVLLDGGCAEVVVVLGAAEPEAREALADVEEGLTVIVCPTWERGMGESLRSGIAALQARSAQAALVHLVDLPDVGAAVVRRLLAAATGRDALARAAYDGVPGHPVLIGGDHLPGVAELAVGDSGAREYLRRHRPALVECGDLAGGRDVDRMPPDA